MQNFLSKKDSVAVVGVSSDPNKYGYKVFFDLLNKGYTVYAVHPDGGEVGGIVRYISLKNIPSSVDVVIMVVPPSVTDKVVHECKELGISKVWMQPGSESDYAISFCEKEKIEIISKACIIIESNT